MRVLVGFLLCFALAPNAARAADWPSQAVTMVVPFAGGGPTDVLARVLQPFLARELGQPVVVENVPGGGGVDVSRPSRWGTLLNGIVIRLRLALPNEQNIRQGRDDTTHEHQT